MKRRGRYLWMSAAMIAAMIFGMTGCGAASDSANYVTKNATAEYDTTTAEEAYYDDYDYAYEPEMFENEAQSITVDESAAQTTTGRKLIRTVHMQVETLEFDEVVTTLQEQTATLGGYIEKMDLYNGSKYSYYQSTRRAEFTLRIPKNKLDEFLNTVSGITNVTNRSEQVEDVTLTYSDLDSHKAVLKAEHARLLEFLEQAETVEDMLAIEDRLYDLQYQIDSMESQLRTYDNKVDYSAVYLTVSEVEELTPTEEEEQTTWERITEGFTDHLFGVLDGLKEFFIWFVIHIPNLILIAVIVCVIVLIIKKWRKHRREKKARKMNPYAPVAGQPDKPVQAEKKEQTDAPAVASAPEKKENENE